ncbi:MAG TPA: serine/threonine-protein kinase [Gemmatimonadales bacterium]|nr:serine/threonine-protein kinase [Gemmatimonadales bacterium]
MIAIRWISGEIDANGVGRYDGRGPSAVSSLIIAVSRGQWVRHQTGGGHTPKSQSAPQTSAPSAAARSLLGFRSAMPMDSAGLQRRLQQALGDEFSVGPLLGQGGFAAVFRAREKDLNRDVAVKVLDLGSSPSPTLAERFVREAQTIARLEHPNIVPIYDVGKRDDLLYLSMRCVDGPSLRQLLTTHKRLSVGDAARLTRQVADALAYAHSQGVVHRDVKPDNILLDSRGHVLVTDFGIAKVVQDVAQVGSSELTTEGMIIGTPQYMSPEQAAGEKVDARSDIYSLGIVLYQMLAGAAPFDGESSAKILAKQLTATPEPITRLRPDVSEGLADVLDRMLAKDPARRFQNAADLSRALVDTLPGAARSRVHLPWRRRLGAMALRSLFGLAVGGCLAFVAFVAGALVVLWTVFSKPPRLVARAPVPDSVTAALVKSRALAAGDTALFAFQPDGAGDSTLLMVSRRAVAVVTPHATRAYRRDAVTYHFGLDFQHNLDRGLCCLPFVLRPNGAAPDTVYANLSPRSFIALAPVLDTLLASDSERAARPRVQVRVGP